MKVYALIYGDPLGGYSSEVMAVCQTEERASQEAERLGLEPHAVEIQPFEVLD